MKPSQLLHALSDLHATNIPAFIWGAAGIAKSAMVRAYAQSIGVPLIDYRLYLREAVDVMGLPGVVDGVTTYAKPAELPNNPDWRGIIFFDEWCIASHSQQAPGMQLFLDRMCGGFKLPVGAYLVAASNRQSDRGLFHRLLDPQADRVCHLDLEADLTDWLDWAARSGEVGPEVPAFLRFRPNLLHSYDPQRKWHAQTTPRGWADVAKIIPRRSMVEADLIRGRVGDAAAGEFIAFLKLAREMVSPDEILKNPKTAEVPTNNAVLYALAEALARRATLGNWGAVTTYAKRMPKEYAQCMVSSAKAILPALCNTREYIDWASKNG